MRYYCALFLILVIFSLSGCTGKQEYESNLESAKLKISELQKQVDGLKGDLDKQKLTSQTQDDYLNSNIALRVVDVDDKSLRYILTSEKHDAQSVSIIGSNIDGLVENYEEIQWQVDNSGSFFKVEVTGSIFDFQLMNLKFDENLGDFVEDGVFKELKELRNKTLYIETDLPEGGPLNKIKWKDQKGKEHEIYLSFDGYGFNGSVFWSR